MDDNSSSTKNQAESHVQDIHESSNERGICRRTQDIGLALFILAIPMVLFTSILLGLIFAYRVTAIKSIFPGLQISDDSDGAGAYFVNLNSTFLIFIASWSSSVAPLLVGFALTLYSYPVARDISSNISDNDIYDLPTPYQLTMLVQFFSGSSMNALWTWVCYVFGWRRKQSQSVVVTRTAIVAILTTVLAVIVFVTDTWLHVTTKTVTLLHITPLYDGIDYSIVLTEPCFSNDDSSPTTIQNGCILDHGGTDTFIINGRTSLEVLGNVSKTMTVLAHYESQTAYLGIPPTTEIARRDYTASTFGLKTNCQLISTQCNLNGDVGAFTPFDCSSAFSGDLTSGPDYQQAYFTDGSMSSNVTSSTGVENPFYFGVAARMDSDGQGYVHSVGDDPELVTPTHGGVAFVLLCDITVLDITYDSVNGSITRFDSIPSNYSVTNIWQGPNAETSMGRISLQQAIHLTVLSNSSQEMAEKFALSYSETALAVAAGAVQPDRAQAAQERSEILAARVPKAPLFTLVIANLSFVLLGIFLSIFAFRASSMAETGEIQARLSIKGLAANHLGGRLARSKVQKVEELFDEYRGGPSSRIGINPAPEGGHKYQIYSEIVTPA